MEERVSGVPQPFNSPLFKPIDDPAAPVLFTTGWAAQDRLSLQLL